MKDVTVNYTYTRMPGYLVKEFCFVTKVNHFFSDRFILSFKWKLHHCRCEFNISMYTVAVFYCMFVDILNNLFSSCSTDRIYKCYDSKPLWQSRYPIPLCHNLDTLFMCNHWPKITPPLLLHPCLLIRFHFYILLLNKSMDLMLAVLIEL